MAYQARVNHTLSCNSFSSFYKPGNCKHDKTKEELYLEHGKTFFDGGDVERLANTDDDAGYRLLGRFYDEKFFDADTFEPLLPEGCTGKFGITPEAHMPHFKIYAFQKPTIDQAEASTEKRTEVEQIEDQDYAERLQIKVFAFINFEALRRVTALGCSSED
jgi:hypothetical protein